MKIFKKIINMLFGRDDYDEDDLFIEYGGKQFGQILFEINIILNSINKERRHTFLTSTFVDGYTTNFVYNIQIGKYSNSTFESFISGEETLCLLFGGVGHNSKIDFKIIRVYQYDKEIIRADVVNSEYTQEEMQLKEAYLSYRKKLINILNLDYEEYKNKYIGDQLIKNLEVAINNKNILSSDIVGLFMFDEAINNCICIDHDF